MRTRFVGTYLVAGLLAVALPGRAQEANAEASARVHFDAGSDAVRRGELGRAAEEFEAAQALSPNPIVLYNLGQTYSALGQPVKAERALRLYLASEPPPTDRARIAEVEALLEFNARRIGTIRVELVPADASLEVDGSPAELAAPGQLRLAAGRHVLVAAKDGYATSVMNVDVTAGVETPARLALAPAVPLASATAPLAATAHDTESPPVLAAETATPAPVRRAPSGQRVTSYALLAMGGAALGMGAVYAFEANRLSHASNRDGHCDATGCDDQGLQLRAAAVENGNWATGWLIGGVVTATAGLLLHLLEPKDPQAHQQSAANRFTTRARRSDLSLPLRF